MTIHTVSKIVECITAATINGICIGFWLIFIAEIWKWAYGVMKKALLSLFPGLKDIGKKEPKKKDDRDLVP